MCIYIGEWAHAPAADPHRTYEMLNAERDCDTNPMRARLAEVHGAPGASIKAN